MLQMHMGYPQILYSDGRLSHHKIQLTNFNMINDSYNAKWSFSFELFIAILKFSSKLYGADRDNIIHPFAVTRREITQLMQHDYPLLMLSFSISIALVYETMSPIRMHK